MNSAAMCAPRLARAKLSASGPRTLLEEFSYADVSLNPGVMSSLAQAQFEQTQAVMLGMNEDSLLKPWRLRAGLPAPGPEMGGWYDVEVSSDTDKSFTRRLSGHLENGKASVTDPAIGASV